MLAKRGQMVLSGMANLSDLATKKAISKEELERHCRRRTRGGTMLSFVFILHVSCVIVFFFFSLIGIRSDTAGIV